MTAHHRIPSSSFASTQTAVEERFTAWQAIIDIVFDTAPLTREGLENFEASVKASHLGQLLLVEHSFGAQQFSRHSARIARDGLDPALQKHPPNITCADPSAQTARQLDRRFAWD